MSRENRLVMRNVAEQKLQSGIDVSERSRTDAAESQNNAENSSSTRTDLRRFIVRLLELLNQRTDNADIISDILSLTGEFKNCETIDIRPEEGKDLPHNDKGKTVSTLCSGEDITECNRAEDELESVNERLLIKQASLQQKNIALYEIMEQIENEKKLPKIQIHKNLNKVIRPIIETLRMKGNSDLIPYIDLLDNSLYDITSPFINNLDINHEKLTPRELEVSNLIKNGMSTKEIASFLNISIYTVQNQRKTIRKKLGIKGNSTNLSTLLRFTEDSL